jgi:hypothetical protein
MDWRRTGWPPGPTVAVGVTFMTGRRKAAGLLEMREYISKGNQR